MNSIYSIGDNSYLGQNRSQLENSQFSSLSRNDYQHNVKNIDFKVILLGDVSVGKTSIFERYINNNKDKQFEPTISTNCDVKVLSLDANTCVKMSIYDTAGQEVYRATTKSYVIGSNGIIIVFSIVEPKSFQVLKEWVKIVEDIIDIKKCTVFIVGNKLDRENERVISYEEGEAFAKENNFMYMEISAKEGTNVDNLFEKLALDMVNKSNEEGEVEKGNNNLNLKDSNNLSGPIGLGKSALRGRVNKAGNSKYKKPDTKCC